MKTVAISLRALLLFTALTALYTLAVTGVAGILFPYKASGSLVERNGKVIGSELLAQKFSDPGHFQPRPSSIDFNPLPSGATNFSPSSADLKKAVEERAARGLTDEMLYASGSGLDPHISPATVFAQVDRVAAARQLDGEGKKRLREMVVRHIERRQFGLLGEERVNVLLLNMALDIE